MKGTLSLSFALVASAWVASYGQALPAESPPRPAPGDPCFDPSPLHMKVSTRVEGAQQALDKGLTFLHSYVWHGAVHCLNEALDLDPGLAVAHTGLARAYLGQEDYEQARHHATEAVRLAEGDSVSDREKAWVRLGLDQVEASTSPPNLIAQRHAQYKRSIETYLASYPDDPLGFVLRGNAESRRPQDRGQTGHAGSISWYQRALELDPSHFAAHHFLTHSYENVGQYEKAVEHARHFTRAAPKIPHAFHMLGHVLPRLGQWDEALDVLETAHRLHLESFEQGSVAPEDDWHYGHNLRLLAVVHYRLGHQKKAERYLTRLYHAGYGGPRAAFYCLPLAQYLLVRGRFEDALSHAHDCLARPEPAAKLVGEISAGEALLGLGKLEEAKATLARAGQILAKLRLAGGPRSEEDVYVLLATSLSLQTLQGKIALRSERPEEGHSLLVAIADRLVGGTNFDSWASGFLLLEGLARDAHRSGRPETARAVAARLQRLDQDYEIRWPKTPDSSPNPEDSPGSDDL